MADVVEALIRSFGTGSVVVDPEIISSNTVDWTGRFKGDVLCVVRPVNSWQVQRAVEISRSTHTPITTQGGNTSLVGGATPVHGGIILSSLLLNEIEIDTSSQTARVGAGVTLNALNLKAKEWGLCFAVDLASRDSATLGGMIATNAGGIHMIRYGGTRQQLIGIEAILGTGKLISRMEGLYKDNSGYDWASILCGSEGTLGVITKAIVKLIPVPKHRTVALIAVDTLSGAIRIMVDARRRFPHLDAVEFMSRDGLELVHRLQGKKWPLGEIPVYSLLIEVAGDVVEIDELAEFLDDHNEVVDAAISYDGQAEGLWYWREQHSVAISRAGIPYKLDVAIPILEMPGFLNYVSELVELEYPKVRVVAFGHLGDGNVHVNLLNVGSPDDEIEHEILASVASYGGSISAEHGIGRAKIHDLSLTRSPQDIDSMRSIKKVLDPTQILNPGILFE
ncbi:MAG: FAD-binding oxidoreductase [Acidimicrobiaceae bacterium]|nr:FAD-binding oxidoreductase [Acidimicrobiaceae bacterium]